MIGWENIELISDRPLEVMLDEFARLKKEFPGRILIASIMEEYNRVRGAAGFWREPHVADGSCRQHAPCNMFSCIRVTKPCATRISAGHWHCSVDGFNPGTSAPKPSSHEYPMWPWIYRASTISAVADAGSQLRGI